MVLGAGALGNEVLKNLTLLNIGNIIVVDFDFVEFHNLSRSILFDKNDIGRKKVKVVKEKINALNSKVNVITIEGTLLTDVGLGLIKQMDVIIGCVDNQVARLETNRLCQMVGKVWIDGAIENLSGTLKVFEPGESCFECSLTNSEKKQLRKMSCADVINYAEEKGNIPTTPISASIIGGLLVQEALKVITGYGKLMKEHNLYYEGFGNNILLLKNKPIKDDCLGHFKIQDTVKSPLSSSSTIYEVMNWLIEYFKDDELRIELKYEVVTEIIENSTHKKFKIFCPRPYLENKTLLNQIGVDLELNSITIDVEKSIYFIDNNCEYKKNPISTLGIPKLHIISVLGK